MTKYWIFNVIITVLFIAALTMFFRFSFTNEGFVYFAIAAIILSILSFINYKMNYKKKPLINDILKSN